MAIMALDFRIIGFGFASKKGSEQVLIGSVDFGRPVTRAQSALNGFNSHYDGGDHNLLQHKIITNIDRIEGSRVFVKVTYLLRDSSGNIDDKFSGGVHVLVFADVATGPVPPIFFGSTAAARLATRPAQARKKVGRKMARRAAKKTRKKPAMR
jgi:hypothetical protein